MTDKNIICTWHSVLFFQVEKKAQTTVLTAALLLSGIPAEVINRSMDTYRRMGDVFADLCIYFFTFILSHEILQLTGSETPWRTGRVSSSSPPSRCLLPVSPIELRRGHSWCGFVAVRRPGLCFSWMSTHQYKSAESLSLDWSLETKMVRMYGHANWQDGNSSSLRQKRLDVIFRSGQRLMSSAVCSCLSHEWEAMESLEDISQTGIIKILNAKTPT